MLWLAVTTLEKLQGVPPRFWVNVLLAAGAVIVGYILLRHAAQMNRLILTLIIGLFLLVTGFQWIFERNEPRFMTPFVEVIAPFFPQRSKTHF
tara:strand:+ start:297 stop:575 length:279 start_codon:yes stop_codon:yes gene_type:complete